MLELVGPFVSSVTVRSPGLLAEFRLLRVKEENRIAMTYDDHVAVVQLLDVM